MGEAQSFFGPSCPYARAAGIAHGKCHTVFVWLWAGYTVVHGCFWGWMGDGSCGEGERRECVVKEQGCFGSLLRFWRFPSTETLLTLLFPQLPLSLVEGPTF